MTTSQLILSHLPTFFHLYEVTTEGTMGINERVQIIHSHLVLLEKEIQFANLRGKLTYFLRFLSRCLVRCLAT